VYFDYLNLSYFLKVLQIVCGLIRFLVYLFIILYIFNINIYTVIINLSTILIIVGHLYVVSVYLDILFESLEFNLEYVQNYLYELFIEPYIIHADGYEDKRSFDGKAPYHDNGVWHSNIRVIKLYCEDLSPLIYEQVNKNAYEVLLKNGLDQEHSYYQLNICFGETLNKPSYVTEFYKYWRIEEAGPNGLKIDLTYDIRRRINVPARHINPNLYPYLDYKVPGQVRDNIFDLKTEILQGKKDSSLLQIKFPKN
jgi:hypothetical protein